MASARHDYFAWLAQYEAKQKPQRLHGADAPGSIFTEPVARSFSATSSLRRGHTTHKPRLHASDITGPCIVITASGDRYTLKRGNRNTVSLAQRLAQIDSKAYARNHASIHPTTD